MDTSTRLKRQQKRRKEEAKKVKDLNKRWFGRGIDGLEDLLNDAVAGGKAAQHYTPGRKKRAGYTRRGMSGKKRTEGKQGTTRAPRTPYQVYCRRPGKSDRLLCATDSQMMATLTLRELKSRFGEENLTVVGF